MSDDSDDEEPEIADSARKHGVSDEDMWHVWRVFMTAEKLDEKFTMLVGMDQSGRLIEVGVSERTGPKRIVHALRPARRRFLSGPSEPRRKSR